jgi:hypothetical protein
VDVSDRAQAEREETRVERADRNLSELTGELRVAVTGVQVLFAFLLVSPFDSGFSNLSRFERLLIGSTLFGAGAGIATVAAALVLFGGFWFGLPLHRRRQIERNAPPQAGERTNTRSARAAAARAAAGRGVRRHEPDARAAAAGGVAPVRAR